MNPAEILPGQAPIAFEEAGELLEELDAIKDSLVNFANRFRGRSGVDQRWLAIGVTDIEKGVMAVGRSIAEAPLKAGAAEIKKLLAEQAS